MANLLLIRDLCEKNKIKIRELASRIGKEESSIQSMIRTGSTNTKTLEAIAEAVSYTHLDVYKRQVSRTINRPFLHEIVNSHIDIGRRRKTDGTDRFVVRCV